MRTVIIKPLITELSMKDAGKSKFTFLVRPDASKTDIRGAVEKLFNVKVINISTVSFTRNKSIYTRFGRKKTTSHIKKARVALQKGQTIPAFETGEKEERKKEKKDEK